MTPTWELSDLASQQAIIWPALQPQEKIAIFQPGTLSNQPVKIPYKKGCARGGGDCENCTIIPCGGKVPCSRCTVIHCRYPPPNCFGRIKKEG